MEEQDYDDSDGNDDDGDDVEVRELHEEMTMRHNRTRRRI